MVDIDTNTRLNKFRHVKCVRNTKETYALAYFLLQLNSFRLSYGVRLLSEFKNTFNFVAKMVDAPGYFLPYA